MRLVVRLRDGYDSARSQGHPHFLALLRETPLKVGALKIRWVNQTNVLGDVQRCLGLDNDTGKLLLTANLAIVPVQALYNYPIALGYNLGDNSLLSFVFTHKDFDTIAAEKAPVL